MLRYSLYCQQVQLERETAEALAGKAAMESKETADTFSVDAAKSEGKSLIDHTSSVALDRIYFCHVVYRGFPTRMVYLKHDM